MEKIFSKKKFVKKIFNDVANKYDIMNDLMSFGLHHVWKKKFINEMKIKKKNKILDIGSGTGDIFNQILNENIVIQPNQIILSDPNINMIKTGKKKINKKINWIATYAENLPFKNNEFDLITMSFSLRNVYDLKKSLKEIHRVLKNGGKFLCLEFGKIDNPGINQIYKIYTESFIPKLGKIIANNEAAYIYLIESIKKFPNQETLCKILKKNKFKNINYSNLSFGSVAIYSCFKIK